MALASELSSAFLSGIVCRSCFMITASLYLLRGSSQVALKTVMHRLPLCLHTMSDAHGFVAALARAGKCYKEIKATTDASYGMSSLSRAQIYRIIQLVKEGKEVKNERGRATTKHVRTDAVIASVAAAVEADARVTVRELAAANGVSKNTILKIIHSDLGLSKKSARWVPKLLNMTQKMERVRVCTEFVAAVHRHSMSYLDTIVTMDKTMVSHHTPETKRQSKRWVKKGSPGHVKARVHASRSKQMVLAFFDAKGIIYTNIVPRGEKVNADYMVKTLRRFLVVFKKKRPNLETTGWCLHWDNAPVHTAAKVHTWIADNSIELLEHPLYSPDLAPADFFLFPKVKERLAGKSIASGGLKTAWEGVTSSISIEDFATAFRRWFEHCNKCVEIGGDYVEKS